MPNARRHPRPWLSAFWQRAYRENVTGLSAMVAYNLMLAVFPFALLVLFVFGQVLKIKGVETSVVSDLERLFPSVEQQTLTDVLNRIQDNSTTIGIAWLTTPTRTRAMSSGPRSCSLASAIARSIGPWL